MNKLSLKLTAAGWIVLLIGLLITGHWGSYINGIAAGLFISSIWVMRYEYKNQ